MSGNAKTTPVLACSRLSVGGDDRKSGRATSGGLVGEKERSPSPFLSRIPLAADPACRPLAFSIVPTYLEPGTGYAYARLVSTRCSQSMEDHGLCKRLSTFKVFQPFWLHCSSFLSSSFSNICWIDGTSENQ